MSEPERLSPYFRSLLDELTSRGARAAQGLLSLGSDPLRAHLSRNWTQFPGAEGALLGDPVFEPTFGWEEADVTMKSLGGNLLHPRLLKVMSNPPRALASEYSFPLDRHPFSHQMESWRLLSAKTPRSLVVTSGTGSGKTECFLVPVLNSLAYAADSEGPLQGVRALFIYPLNALINSQQSRLDAWTHGFSGEIRHCLYTGALENNVRSRQREFAGQVIDRSELRASAPPILVTNATMLEFMLVRREDAPILEQSAGKLQWIVLDEAHTYVGSQAAEMALLLRRVMLAFKVNPQDVRFIATSATFRGDAQSLESLRDFLADMAGIPASQVAVVSGRREHPTLAPVDRGGSQQTLEEIAAIDPTSEESAARFGALTRSRVARQLRNAFIVEQSTQSRALSDLSKAMDGLAPDEVLRWLDVASGTREPGNQHFLPLRAHVFHNVVPTLRVCIDQNCIKRAGTSLDVPTWSYGMAYAGGQTRCDCGAPLLPLVSCNECNEHYLLGAIADGKLRDPSQEDEDAFVLEDPDAEDDEGDGSGHSTELLVTNRPFEATLDDIAIESTTLAVLGATGAAGAIPIAVFHQTDGHECPKCGTRSAAERLLRFARVGTPFTLSTVIATLLEYCPPDRHPAEKPFDGRKMISFTDSRQGTARIAVKLQQDSERARVRGLVYQRVLRLSEINVLSPDDETLLSELLSEEREGHLTDRDKKLMERLVSQKSSRSLRTVSWDDMVAYLANTPDVQNGMMDHYFRIAPFAFENRFAHRALAGMLLAREFYRRPKRANSLETLGLVKVDYPNLSKVLKAPSDWLSDLPDWRCYLKVLLDYYVRENSFIQLDANWLRIIGAKIRTKWILPPTMDTTNTNRIKRWPQVREGHQKSRAVLLLSKAFNIDVAVDRDRIDAWLQLAWRDLVENARVLERFGDGFQLVPKHISFEIANEGFICPVTRRFVDTVLKGLSPYTPQGQRATLRTAEPVSIPVPDLPLSDTQSAGVDRARAWCNTDTQVLALRNRGLWSDIHDRVIEGGSYYRAAEHSAQQPKSRLQAYETAFKAGRINLLSCSTTMELGVDIGGITVVAMNNVPPHPSNYLQRAGRAGRRREGRSLALTVCKNTPHDQYVFGQPRWAFDTVLRLPQVSLQSAALVQRHVNAYLLSYWMKEIAGVDALRKLQCGTFFLGGPQMSLADRFGSWCDTVAGDVPPALSLDISRIVARSALAGVHVSAPIRQSASLLSRASRNWFDEYAALNAQAASVGRANSPPARALQIQKDRMEGEYLLKQLATSRFLPGYGFPSDIVSFDTLSKANIGQLLKGKDREDNRGRFRDLASRDRVTGLREYAPGAEVVMDGLVYRSAGITLNWRAPASEQDVKEAQLFKHAWRCSRCGACSSRVVREMDQCCDVCGAEIDKENLKEYLVPSGFSVDFLHDEPHTDISSPKYVPVKKPWLGIRDGNWVRLANPMLGQYRSSRNAQLFHHTAGEHGSGFAICLECGRAEPMLGLPDERAAGNEQRLPIIFRRGQQHTRLRGGRDEGNGSICKGSDDAWKIKSNVCLGHDTTTDAIELMLFDTKSGGWLPNGVASFSIAVALRNAIAGVLGVQAEELGCDCTPVLHEGREVGVIQVFDLRSGGYCSQALQFINEPTLWHAVLGTLLCSCSRACQKCLLSFDTRFESDRLDRHAALHWVNAEWLAQLVLPKERQVLGPGTTAEIAPIREAIERELHKGLYDEVVIYLQGDLSEWDFGGAHHLRARVAGWRSEGLRVRICIPETSVQRLDEDNIWRLSAFAANDVAIEEATIQRLDSGFVPVVGISSRDHALTWACDDVSAAAPGRYWGQPSGAVQFVVAPVHLETRGSGVSSAELRNRLNKAAEYSLKSELDGSLKDFGGRFWEWLCSSNDFVRKILESGDVLRKATYSDRYVRSPLTCAVLTSVLHVLCSRAGTDAKTRVNVFGQSFTRELDRPLASMLWHDWPTDALRDDALCKALAFCGVPAIVKSHQSRPHGRSLELVFGSKASLRLRFDQGFSFWEVARGVPLGRRASFDFRVDADRQGELIAQLDVPVVGVERSDTQIFVITS